MSDRPHAATADMAVTSVRVHPNGVHLVATTEAAVLVRGLRRTLSWHVI